MFSGFMAKCFAVALLLFLCSSRISGFSVGSSHEANERSSTIWPLVGVSERSMLLKIFLSKPVAFLDYVPTVGIAVDILVDRLRVKEFLESIFLATSWSQKALPHMNINSIIVRSSFEGPTLLLSTLQTIHSALTVIDLDQNIKVSPLFSLPTLENYAENSEKDLQRIINFVSQSRSFITVEVIADRDLILGDGFINHVIQRAIIACSLMPNSKIPIVLHLKSFLPGPNGVSVAKLIDKISIYVEINPKITDRILGFFVQVPPFKSFHRELLGKETKPIFSAKLAIHDTYATNPTMAPITVPSTSPSQTPTIITVPATNPSSVLPTIPSTDPMQTPITIPSANPLPITNPTNAPITVPATNPMPDPATNPTNPVNTPIAVPSTNPMQNPVTNPSTSPTFSPPVMPETNPVTTPTTNPANQPVTSPSTTYPGTRPVSPTGFGQTWCVAKSGLPDSALQLALDYACGMGGADCSAIQEMGSCYNPNTLQAHASYAFNSYYQRNLVPSSCIFGGSSMIVTVNPSTVTCIYPSSSPASNYNPATGLNPAADLNPATGSNPASGLNPASGYNPASSASSGSTSSGSSVLNTNSAGGSSSSTDFGSDDSNGSVSSISTSLLVGWVLPIFLLASTCSFW